MIAPTAAIFAPRSPPLAVTAVNMAKARKRAGRRSSDNFDDYTQFARAVQAEYARALRDGAEQHHKDLVARDVRRVALALATIRGALDHILTEIKTSGDIKSFVDFALNDSFEILDAIVYGREHPVLRHIDGARSIRGTTPAVSNPELLRRWIVVGFVRAYQQAAQVSEIKAINKIIELCFFEDFDFGLEEIKGWSRRFREAGDEGPDAVAHDLIAKAETSQEPWPLADRVIAWGRQWVFTAWGTPRLGKGPHSAP